MAFDKVSVRLPAKLRAVSMGKNPHHNTVVSGKTTKISALVSAPSVFARGTLDCSVPAQEQQIICVSFGFLIITGSQKV